MKIRMDCLFVVLVVLVAFFATARRVQAALGESVESVESDRKALSAMRGTVTGHNGYTVHRVDSDSTSYTVLKTTASEA